MFELQQFKQILMVVMVAIIAMVAIVAMVVFILHLLLEPAPVERSVRVSRFQLPLLLMEQVVQAGLMLLRLRQLV